jgi:integrase
LRRLKTSGVYYVFAKRGGKQFRRSLHTTDKAQARRHKDDFMRELDRLASAEAAQITFEQLAARWIEAERHTLKESSAARRAACVKAIAPAFLGLQIRNVTARHCEAWAIARVKEISAPTFTKELETMRGAFRYATAQGLILRDPSANIKRPRIVNRRPHVPSRPQFESIVASIRGESQGKGDEGANLVELLAYSGMRLNEARSLRWRDVNFSQGGFTVTGGERGTKNHEQRPVPLSDEMRGLLTRLKRARGKAAPDTFIVQTTSARKCLETACRKLGLPNFHHHSLRHYFATCAIESSVDIPTVARWLGHKDGGALLMKTYAHLQQAHSVEQMKRVNFRVVPAASQPGTSHARSHSHSRPAAPARSAVARVIPSQS